MNEVRLGKIKNIKFGYVGYQDMMFGLSIEFSAPGIGVNTHIAHAWSIDMEVDEHSKWNESDRDKGFAKTMREINQIMKDANVTDINQLKNIPVEITFEGNTLKSWRVLKEVL